MSETLLTIPESSEDNTVVELSPEKTAQILFDTFRFGQRSPYLQPTFFQWIHIKNPALRIANPIDAYKKSENLISRFLFSPASPHSEIKDDRWKVDLKNQLNTFEKFLEGEQKFNLNYPELMEYIAAIMIDKDYEYLIPTKKDEAVRGIGRDRKKQEDAIINNGKNIDIKAPINDKYSSHICDYVLLGKTTKSEIFDELFSEIRTVVTERKFRERDALKQVIKVYNKYHGTKIKL